MIINTSVNLIHLVPDTVMAWIAPGTQSNGSGSQIELKEANISHPLATEEGFEFIFAKNLADQYAVEWLSPGGLTAVFQEWTEQLTAKLVVSAQMDFEW